MRWCLKRSSSATADADIIAAEQAAIAKGGYVQSERNASEAFDRGDFIGPEDKSVLDFTAKMLELRPGDSRALEIRQEAASVLRKRADIAADQLDIKNATELYNAILKLLPNDEGARVALSGLAKATAVVPVTPQAEPKPTPKPKPVPPAKPVPVPDPKPIPDPAPEPKPKENPPNDEGINWDMPDEDQIPPDPDAPPPPPKSPDTGDLVFEVPPPPEPRP